MEYVSKVTSIITDLQGWILLLVGAITTLRIAKEGVAYQQGGISEKANAMQNIKSTLYMGGGIFALVWFATYIVTKMK
jgi:hypothetical protein